MFFRFYCPHNFFTPLVWLLVLLTEDFMYFHPHHSFLRAIDVTPHATGSFCGPKWGVFCQQACSASVFYTLIATSKRAYTLKCRDFSYCDQLTWKPVCVCVSFRDHTANLALCSSDTAGAGPISASLHTLCFTLSIPGSLIPYASPPLQLCFSLCAFLTHGRSVSALGCLPADSSLIHPIS